MVVDSLAVQPPPTRSLVRPGTVGRDTDGAAPDRPRRRDGSEATVDAVLGLLAGGKVTEGLERLDRAIDTLVDQGDFRAAARLLGRTSGELLAAGLAAEVLTRNAALTKATTAHDGTEGLRGRLWAARSTALRADGQILEAIDASQEAVALLDGRAPESVVTTLRHDRAVLLAEAGHPEEAITGLVQAREAFLSERDRLGVAASDHNLSFVLHDLATFDDAMEYLNEARDIFLAIGMVEEAAACDQNLGVILYDLGRYEEAGRRFAVARHRYDSVDARRSAGECDSNLAALLDVMGHPDEAETYRRRATERGVDAPLEPGLSGQVPVVPEAQPAGSFGNALA